MTGKQETEIGLSLKSGVPGNMTGSRTDDYLFSALHNLTFRVSDHNRS
jgi:hypothetical protein